MRKLSIMGKLSIIILSFFILIGCCSCAKSVEYPSYFNEKPIQSIQIVKAENYIENQTFYHTSDLVYEVVQEIENIEKFKEEFLLLDFFTVYNPSSSTPSGYYSIKFNYGNGIYELFDYCGYVLYKPENKTEISKFVYCNSEDYYKLIEEWIGSAIDTESVYDVRGKR